MSSEETSTQNTEATGGGCLIATAAFGSELAPQVQFLRNFRDQYILSTLSGSAFMNTFNTVYYSFSPAVADYEREQPWLRHTIKVALHPLLGILVLSEKSFSSVNGEAGAVLAGATASIFIGVVYLLPITLAKPIQRRLSSGVIKITLISLCIVAISVGMGVLVNSSAILSVSTTLFVLLVAAITVMLIARVVRSITQK